MGNQPALSTDRNRAFVAWAFPAIAVIFMCACRTNNQTDNGTAELTAEDARAALVAMVEASNDGELDFLRDDLADEVVCTDDGTIRIGRWYCNLEKLTFVGHLDGDWMLLDFYGSFVLNEKQQWKATVTGGSRAEWPVEEPENGTGSTPAD